MKVEVDKLSSPFQCRKHWQGTEGAPTETATLTGQWLVKASVCGSARSPLAWWSPGRKRSSHLAGSSQEHQQPYQSCSEASQLQWTVTVPYKWKDQRKTLWIQWQQEKELMLAGITKIGPQQLIQHLLVYEINSHTKSSSHCFHCYTLVRLQELWVDNSTHFPHVVAEMRLKITV